MCLRDGRCNKNPQAMLNGTTTRSPSRMPPHTIADLSDLAMISWPGTAPGLSGVRPTCVGPAANAGGRHRSKASVGLDHRLGPVLTLIGLARSEPLREEGVLEVCLMARYARVKSTSSWCYGGCDVSVAAAGSPLAMEQHWQMPRSLHAARFRTLSAAGGHRESATRRLGCGQSSDSEGFAGGGGWQTRCCSREVRV